MTTIKTQDELIQTIKTTRYHWGKAISGLSVAELTQSGVNGAWSIKDTIAHITDWEQRFLRWYKAGLRGQIPERPEPGLTWDDLDLLNQQIYKRNRDRGLVDVHAESEASYQTIVAAVEVMTASEIFTPGYYEWTNNFPLLRALLANTSAHYADHTAEVLAWRRAQGDHY